MRRYKSVAVLVLAILWHAIAPLSAQSDAPVPTLAAVKTWDYQLRRLNIEAAAARATDMIVVEVGTGGDGTGVKTTEDVERLRVKPDGTRRLVIAYLSIGEAEDYRVYWQPQWRTQPPAWLIGENCRWPKNYPVRYWLIDWQEIMIGPANGSSDHASSALSRIMDLGFDGVYLDRVDVFQDLVDLGELKLDKARSTMIAFVQALSTRAKARQKTFRVIVQNAEELLDSAAYRRAIDAIAKEDMLHGLGGTGVRNTADDIKSTRASLLRLQRDKKPVFAIEYLTNPDAIAQSRAELTRDRFAPVFPTRGLEGSDPTVAAVPLSGQQGTPEYGAANCTGLLKAPVGAVR
jgi:cysteinyl-tRNA synthetase, unknown class